jgi:hypothetical protein
MIRIYNFVVASEAKRPDFTIIVGVNFIFLAPFCRLITFNA